MGFRKILYKNQTKQTYHHYKFLLDEPYTFEYSPWRSSDKAFNTGTEKEGTYTYLWWHEHI